MSSCRIHCFGLGAMLGGVAWVAYGIFLLLQPWGIAKHYWDDLGYEVVTRPLLYQIYYLPGSGALCLLALGLLEITAQWPLPLRRPGKTGVILTTEEQQRTLFAVLPDGFAVADLVTATEQIIGTLDGPNTGILFIVPVSQVWGLKRP